MSFRPLAAASSLVLSMFLVSPAYAQTKRDDLWAECFLNCQNSGYHTDDYCTVNCNRLYPDGEGGGGGSPEHPPTPVPPRPCYGMDCNPQW